jgi:ornithine cyclodeaminase
MMPNRMLCLSEAHVMRALSIEQAIEANERAFMLFASGKSHVPHRIIMQEGKNFDLFKPASTPETTGLKVVCVRPGNAELNLPTVPATVFLIDKLTALPRAIMGGTHLTAVRTAAGSGVATRLFSRENSKVCTVVGAGYQAHEHIKAMLTVRPGLKTINIVNRGLGRARALASCLSPAYPHVLFNAYELNRQDDGMAQAVRSADIICLTTNSPTPVFDGAWVQPGAHINAIGSYSPTVQELDSAAVRRALVVVDSDEAVKTSGDLAIPLAEGVLTDRSTSFPNSLYNDTKNPSSTALPLSNEYTWAEVYQQPLAPGIYGSLGQFLLLYARTPAGDGEGKSSLTPTRGIMQGIPALRRSGEEITLFKSTGLAIQDIVTAAAVLESAERLNLGVSVDM